MIEHVRDLRSERPERDVLAPVLHFAVAAQTVQAGPLQILDGHQRVVDPLRAAQPHQHGVLGQLVQVEVEIGALVRLREDRRTQRQ
ncbi:MAG: hypothetical protein E6J88_11410 [Deltaproteobacteria bacterium]|nr:MAG: hypothetical protein E6J88_11410 [Deltaproteobacteria bacterium]